MELENFQDIIDFPNYKINENGDIYSKKRNRLMKKKIFNGYSRIGLRRDNKSYTKSIHRLLGIQYLPNPDNLPCIDHINRIRLDNNLNNLRWVSYSTNSKNKSSKKNSTSIYVGVRKTKNIKKPYRAETTYQHKKYSIGYYKTEEEAYEAYKKFNLDNFDIEIT
jgi:hypothetical protein